MWGKPITTRWLRRLAAVLGCLSFGMAAAAGDPVLQAAQAAEDALKARVGLVVHDTGSGQSWQYRADERFPMASTVKALICGALLNRGPEAMNQLVRLRPDDLLSYAPTTRDLIGQDVAASQLCAITLRNSDNTAANVVLQVIGGPAGVTAFLRSVGDPVSRLDRNEPSLNEATPGDPRDTTTPQAMAQTMQALVLGNALHADARRQLTDWLIRNEVGGPLLRAGIPGDWRIADRTGSGGFGTRGIVAVMWPPRRAPIVAAIYLTETDAAMDARNAAIAAIGKAIAQAVQ